MLSNAPVTAVLPATDIGRAKKFYSEMLGLTEKDMGMPGDAALYECGSGTSIFIYQRPEAGASHTQASFNVADLEAEMKELREKGVVFEEYDMPGLKTENGVATMEGYKSAWFKDSEGNILSIGQRG